MNSSAWSVPSILVLVLMLLGPALAHQHLVAPIAGFLTFAVALIPGLIALFYGLLRLYRGDRRRGISSALIGALPVIVVATALINGRDIPPINDISTNLDNPPPLTTVDPAYTLTKPGATFDKIQDPKLARRRGLALAFLSLPPRASRRVYAQYGSSVGLR